MNEKNIFLKEEIPYAQFEMISIDRKSLQSMPREILDPLLSGSLTPIIQARVDTRNGNSYAIPMKAQLVRDEKGDVQLLAYPLHKDIDNVLGLNRHELDKVGKGEVITKDFTQKDGTRTQRFVQMDPETKSLMYRDVATLQLPERLKDMEKVKDIELGQNQKEAAQEGKPVELNVGDEKVTVGVDLREPQGFKVVNGDMDEWKRQQAIRYDDAHPEYVGYVQTDENRWEYRQLQIRQEEQKLTDTQKKEKKKTEGLKL